MSISPWREVRRFVLVPAACAAFAGCGGGGGSSPPAAGTPAPTATPTAVPCVSPTSAPASGSAVFYLAPSCAAANTVSGFTIAGDANGLLVVASTVDESVPLSQGSSSEPIQSPPPSDTLDVSIAAGETPSSLRRTAVAPRKAAASLVRAGMRAHAAHPRLIASRALGHLLASSTRDAARPARARSILPTAVGSTAGIWTLDASDRYIQVPSTLAYASTYGDVWVDDTLLSANGGPLSAANIATIGSDYDNAWRAVTPVYGTPDYTSASPGARETTACTGTTEPIFIPDPDDRQAVFVISSASNGGFGDYVDPINLVYNDVASNANCGIDEESNERSGVYLQYDLDAANDPLSHQLAEDDVALGAYDLSHLIEFVGQTITNPGTSGGAFFSTGYIDSPFITEGLGQLAADLAVHRMYPHVAIDVDDNAESAQTYLADPPAYSLTAFYGTDPGQRAEVGCVGCYGDAYLFMRYAYDRFGPSFPPALIDSGLTGFANLANAFGSATTPGNVIADYAVASAVSGRGATSDPRFDVAGFTTYGTYADQFSNSVTLSGPAASATQNAGTNVTYTANLGSFLYLQLGGLPAAESVQVTDQSGTFGLETALSQH